MNRPSHVALLGSGVLLVACGGSVRSTESDAPAAPTAPTKPWSCSAGLQSGAPWPMVGGCSSLRQRSTATGPSKPALRWSFSTPAAANGPPSIGADGTLYLGVQGELYALNADGSVKWTFPSPSGWFYGEPAIAADGTILDVALGDQPTLYALSAAGTVLWTYAAPANPDLNFATSPSVGPDGLVFFALLSGPAPAENELFAVEPGGTLAWSTASAGVMPAIGADETVYVQSSDLASLQALGSDGKPRWSLSIRPTAATLAVGDDGTVYLLQQGGATAGSTDTLTAVSATGVPGKAFDFAYSVAPPPMAISADGTTYLRSQAGSPPTSGVLAVGSGGSLAWDTPLAGSAMTASGTILVAGDVPTLDAAGSVYVGTTASFVASNPCPCGHADVPPGGSGLQAFHADGTSAWTFEPSVAFGSPSMGSDGTLYAATVAQGPSGGFAYAVVAVGD